MPPPCICGFGLGGPAFLLTSLLRPVFGDAWAESECFVRTLTTTSRLPDVGVVRGPLRPRGPTLSAVPYALVGVFFSGSGAQECTGRWSLGSMVRPSQPTIGSLGFGRGRAGSTSGGGAFFGPAGMW